MEGGKPSDQDCRQKKRERAGKLDRESILDLMRDASCRFRSRRLFGKQLIVARRIVAAHRLLAHRRRLRQQSS